MDGRLASPNRQWIAERDRVGVVHWRTLLPVDWYLRVLDEAKRCAFSERGWVLVGDSIGSSQSTGACWDKKKATERERDEEKEEKQARIDRGKNTEHLPNLEYRYWAATNWLNGNMVSHSRQASCAPTRERLSPKVNEGKREREKQMQ